MLLVHRKGATRAFPAGHPDVPAALPRRRPAVLIPADMGRPSFVCVGTPVRDAGDVSARRARGGAQHVRATPPGGPGRAGHSQRTRAAGHSRGSPLGQTLAEEMPQAYKDAADVVEALQLSGIALPVARLRPLGVIKG